MLLVFAYPFLQFVMNFQCPGCNRGWTRQSDYKEHLRLATLPACHAVFLARNRYIDNPRTIPRNKRRASPRARRSSHSRSSSTSDQLHSDHTDNNFQGDFYGTDYTADDFPFPEEDGNPVQVDVSETQGVVDEHSDDESDADVTDGVEKQWEPERQAPRVSPTRSPSVHSTDMDVDNPPAHVNDSEDKAPEPAGQEHLRQANVHVVRFPGQAGAPITDANSASNGYEKYSETVEGSNTNQWAPFTSRVDWEVARWAKLRGPGSTAFSELLAISGVRQVSLCLVQDLKYSFSITRYTKNWVSHTRTPSNSIKSSMKNCLLHAPSLFAKRSKSLVNRSTSSLVTSSNV